MPSPSPSTLPPHLDQRDTYVRCCSAFNTIVPPKLVTMLRDLGLNIALFDWLLNFLMGRPQAVQIGSTTSSTLTLNTAYWSESPEKAEPPTELLSNLQTPCDSSQDSAPEITSPPVEDMKSFHFVSSFVSSEPKLLIVWVECFEDIESFPLSDLLSEMKTEKQMSASNVQLIFIHPLKTGLYQIRFHGNAISKFGLVVPLVNGSVISKRALGLLVRETVINCCHRRWLESDSAPPPHVRRKHMINEIILRYRSRCSEPSFYSALFQNP